MSPALQISLALIGVAVIIYLIKSKPAPDERKSRRKYHIFLLVFGIIVLIDGILKLFFPWIG